MNNNEYAAFANFGKIEPLARTPRAIGAQILDHGCRAMKWRKVSSKLSLKKKLKQQTIVISFTWFSMFELVNAFIRVNGVDVHLNYAICIKNNLL